MALSCRCIRQTCLACRQAMAAAGPIHLPTPLYGDKNDPVNPTFIPSWQKGLYREGIFDHNGFDGPHNKGPIPVTITGPTGAPAHVPEWGPWHAGGSPTGPIDPRSPSSGPYEYMRPSIPSPPPPVVNVAAPNVSVSAPITNVTVNVDGASVTAAVEKRIVQDARVSSGAVYHDGQESPRVTDQGGIRHQ
jgi:hypothetical protein